MFHLPIFAKRLRRLWLGTSLWVLFIVSAFGMVKSSSDPLLPSLRGTPAGAVLTQFPTGNQIIFDLTVGILVGLFIYVLVVWIPERAKRRRIRHNLSQSYSSFKEECILIFFSALQESCDLDLVDRLKDRMRFREYFKEMVSSDQERWHAVLNGLDAALVRRLVVELEIFMTEVHYALTVLDIENQEAFTFLKRLSQILYRFRTWTDQYDDVKRLSGFMWSVHTGWSSADGYTNRDVIAEMIAEI